MFNQFFNSIKFKRVWLVVVIVIIVAPIVMFLVVWSLNFSKFNSSLGAVITPLSTELSNTPIVGAIRWDAWHDGPVGREVEKVLGPKKWRYLLPFFGQEISDTEVLVRADTQAVMDQEIAYANAAGLDYWAFLTYEPMTTSDLSKSFRLYLSSSRKQDINFALILSANVIPPNHQWPTLIKEYVDYFKDPAYQKVAGGRPLFYIYPIEGLVQWAGSEIDARNALAQLRDATVAAGLPPPYFVAMVWDAIQGASYVDSLDLQAISAYANGAGYTYEERPYSALAHSNQNFWEASKNTGKKVIPIVSAGWDPRPRWEIPQSWDPNPVPGTYYVTPTPQELANNLKEAMDWIATNPASAEAKAVIIYAWNEIDEGGWLLPSNTAFNSVGTGRLDAIGTVIHNWTPVSTPITVFEDSFEISEWNGLWTEDSQNDWSRSNERPENGSYSARFVGSGADSQLISTPINLQGKAGATITFDWYINRDMDSGEYLAFDVSTDNGTTWVEKSRLKGDVDSENLWINVSTTLSGINNLKIRFRGTANFKKEKGFVDFVKVIAQ